MKRCNEFNVDFVRGLGSAVSPENNKQRRVTWLLSCVECAVDRSKDAACSLFVMIHVKILTKAASVIAIVAWLRSSLTEVAIQFDEMNGQRVWIEDCCSFCLLDLLDFIAIGIWFRLNSREKVW